VDHPPHVEAPAFLHLAGHPLRWQLLRHLSGSDRRVHELTALVDEPQNVVSYHLGKLREAELVTARRSSADRRDAYYAVDLTRVASVLTATGAALHPALGRLAAAEPPSGTRVLFLCTGNSARSQIAEALVVDRSGGRIDARSAGSHPKPLHPNAIRVMREEHGIDLEGRPSTHVQEVADQRFDRVITLCDRVREVCPELPGAPRTAHWSLPDPAAGPDAAEHERTYPAFVRTAAEIDRRIGFLLADLSIPEPIPA
jgi:protein-tyrosine-phosphatase